MLDPTVANELSPYPRFGEPVLSTRLQEKQEQPRKISEAEKGGGPGGQERTPAQEDQIRKLKERDQEVRAHEAAHLAAAGSLARGGIQYVYQIGPDGQPYAVGGSVDIDTSKGATPEETLAKAAQIRAAALAPADPSPADLRAAAAASQMEAEARQEIAEEQAEKIQENGQAVGAEDIRQIGAFQGSGTSQSENEDGFLVSAGGTVRISPDDLTAFYQNFGFAG